jgi:hypothetical protein
MELTYHQILAEVYDENAKDVLVLHNEYEESEEAYEDKDYSENELSEPEEFNKFAGNRNKPEHIIKPPATDSRKHNPDIRTIVLNIDGGFRGNTIPVITYGPTCNNPPYGDYIPPSDPSCFVFLPSKSYKNISSVKLTSLEFVNSFYTFTSFKPNPAFPGPGNTSYIGRGNTNFIITDNTTNSSTTITIDDGNYTVSLFISTVLPLLQAISSDYNITYSLITDVITILHPTKNFTLTFPTTTSNPYGNGIGYNMGFLNKSYTSTLVGTKQQITSDCSPDVIQDRYVYLQINDWNLVEHHVYGQTHYSAFSKIPLNGTKNTIIFDNNYLNSSTKEYKFHQPTNIDKMEIRMLDAYGNTLDLRGSHFSMTIELQQVNNSAVYQRLLEL